MNTIAPLCLSQDQSTLPSTDASFVWTSLSRPNVRVTARATDAPQETETASPDAFTSFPELFQQLGAQRGSLSFGSLLQVKSLSGSLLRPWEFISFPLATVLSAALLPSDFTSLLRPSSDEPTSDEPSSEALVSEFTSFPVLFSSVTAIGSAVKMGSMGSLLGLTAKMEEATTGGKRIARSHP
jgi:hypothetical protein